MLLNDKFNDKPLYIGYNNFKGFLPERLKERRIVMTPTINKIKTGQQIRLLMEKRGLTVKDVKTPLGFACVQSIYHWLDGQSMPTLDNLYALSELLRVPMDMLVCGNRQYDPGNYIPEGAERLIRYYRMLQDCMAA